MWIVQKSFQSGDRVLAVGEKLEGMEAREVLGPNAAPFLADGRIIRQPKAPKRTISQPTPEPPPVSQPEEASEVLPEPPMAEPEPAAEPEAPGPVASEPMATEPASAGLFSRSKKKKKTTKK